MRRVLQGDLRKVAWRDGVTGYVAGGGGGVGYVRVRARRFIGGACHAFLTADTKDRLIFTNSRAVTALSWMSVHKMSSDCATCTAYSSITPIKLIRGCSEPLNVTPT